MMQQFIKKPVVVGAEQWIGSNISTLSKFMATGKTDFCITKSDQGIIQILTLTGIITVRIGDWIIKGTDDEVYYCPDNRFKKEYALKIQTNFGQRMERQK